MLDPLLNAVLNNLSITNYPLDTTQVAAELTFTGLVTEQLVGNVYTFENVTSNLDDVLIECFGNIEISTADGVYTIEVTADTDDDTIEPAVAV